MSTDELAKLATQHGCDKWNGHWYAGPYAAQLQHLRDREFTLLEVGIGGYENPQQGGASLRMWKDYFRRAQIIGLDIYEKSPHASERIRIYQGSQADPIAIARILHDFPQGFDVVIDDGSHRSEHVIASLVMLWPYVKQDGWYVIEDMQTSYWPNYGGLLHDRNSPQTSMGFIKSLVDCLNWQEIHQPTYTPSNFDLTLTELHFYHNLAFLRKGNNTEGSTVVKQNRIAGV